MHWTDMVFVAVDRAHRYTSGEQSSELGKSQRVANRVETAMMDESA